MFKKTVLVVLIVAGSMGLRLQTFGQAAAPPTAPATTPGTAPAPASGTGEPNADGVYRVGGPVRAPVLLHAENPTYTKEARAEKISGDVLVGLTVDEKGMPQNVTVRQGLNAGLDAKAVEAVRAYRFTPAMKDGVPVPVQLLVKVSFQIF